MCLYKKIYIFFLGVFLILFSLEVVLQCCHFFIKNKINLTQNEDKVYKIVCLGNSYTQGAGAPHGEGYPGHLERLIQEKYPLQKVIVYNWGIPGGNTSMIIAQISKALVDLSPHLIILRGGEPNIANRYRYRDYLKREGLSEDTLNNLIYRAHDLLFNLRIYRFIVYYIEQTSGAVEEKELVISSSYWHEQHIRLFNRYNRVDFSKYSKKKVLEEIDWIRNISKKYPHPHNHLWLARLYFRTVLKDFDSAFNEIAQGIITDPFYYENMNYVEFNSFSRDYSNESLKRKISSFKKKWLEKYPTLFVRFENIEIEGIKRWVSADLKYIFRVAKAKGIKVVMHNYPVSNIFPQARSVVNGWLKDIADEINVPFLDLAKVFLKLKRSSKSYSNFKTQYFSPDDHLNSKGYKINAEKILKLLEDHKILFK